jgi:hypothetical protein
MWRKKQRRCLFPGSDDFTFPSADMCLCLRISWNDALGGAR